MGKQSFQTRVDAWVRACFPPHVRDDRQDRTYRFLEEALELAQANGCSRHDAETLLSYVYSRPKGETILEVGAVALTLAGLCNASRIDLNQAADQELERNWNKIREIRGKHASRPANSPLPQLPG